MSEAWRQWEGTVIEGGFVLGEFQGGSDHSAVFLTSYGPQAQKAAIKFLEGRSPTAAQQLLRWERASRLSHPHLIRVLRWGRCQLGNSPMLYVVTEFADENLAQILPNRSLSATETEYMLRSVLEVLAYLHNAGLAQSALKPSNLMAVGDDLRIASDTICVTGEKRLTAREPTFYDAPEVATSGASPAGDIWSLGVILVEALTQRCSPGQAIRQGDPAVPDTLPAPFLEIARQCLRLDPQRRWMVSDIAARLLPPAPPPKKAASRSPYVLVSAAVLVLFAVLAGPKLLHRSKESPAPAANVRTGTPNRAAQDSAPGAPGPMDQNSQTNVRPKSEERPPAAPTSTSPASPPAAAPSRNVATPSAGSFAPGAVDHKVLPSVSQRSLNTITGKVRVGVKVTVDSSGRVSNASLSSPGPSHYFANLALQSARQWKFTPPRIGEQARNSEWIVKFVFARSGVETQAQQVSPNQP